MMYTDLHGIPVWIEVTDWSKPPNFAVRREEKPATKPTTSAREPIHNPPPQEADGAN